MQTSKFDFDTLRSIFSISGTVGAIAIGVETTLWFSENVDASKKNFSDLFIASSEDLNMNYGLRLGLCFNGVRDFLMPYIFVNGGVNHDFPTDRMVGYVGGIVGVNFLRFFSVDYSCEYNFEKKDIKHLFGIHLDLFIIRDK